MRRISLLGIPGSLRAGSAHGAILRTIAEELLPTNTEMVVQELHDIPLYNEDLDGEQVPLAVAALRQAVAAADALVLGSPEYNHGIPAALKNALDFVYAEWHRKPVAFVGYGGSGGARSIEALTQVARSLKLAALEATVHIMGVNGKIAAGSFTGEERDVKSLAHLFDELAWWGSALKAAR